MPLPVCPAALSPSALQQRACLLCWLAVGAATDTMHSCHPLCRRARGATVLATPAEASIIRQHSSAHSTNSKLLLVPVPFIISNMASLLPEVSLADLQSLMQTGWGHLPGLQLLDKQAAVAAQERELRQAKERERAEEELPALPVELGPLELPHTFDIHKQHNLKRVAPWLLAENQPMARQVEALMSFLCSKFR